VDEEEAETGEAGPPQPQPAVRQPTAPPPGQAVQAPRSGQRPAARTQTRRPDTSRGGASVGARPKEELPNPESARSFKWGKEESQPSSVESQPGTGTVRTGTPGVTPQAPAAEPKAPGTGYRWGKTE
jgi:hypothetical protein